MESRMIIKHRVNKIKDYLDSPNVDGIEIDIRYHNSKLILNHDAYATDKDSDSFEELLSVIDSSTFLIVNLKSEGIEEQCINLLNKYGVANWFFLDMSMPYFVKFAHQIFQTSGKQFGKNNLCVRYSEFESIEYALGFADKVQWVWIDCFTKFPLIAKDYHKLKEKFKLCVVSPELHGSSVERIKEFREIISVNNFKIDAVCTKHPDLWK